MRTKSCATQEEFPEDRSCTYAKLGMIVAGFSDKRQWTESKRHDVMTKARHNKIKRVVMAGEYDQGTDHIYNANGDDEPPTCPFRGVRLPILDDPAEPEGPALIDAFATDAALR